MDIVSNYVHRVPAPRGCAMHHRAKSPSPLANPTGSEAMQDATNNMQPCIDTARPRCSDSSFPALTWPHIEVRLQACLCDVQLCTDLAPRRSAPACQSLHKIQLCTDLVPHRSASASAPAPTGSWQPPWVAAAAAGRAAAAAAVGPGALVVGLAGRGAWEHGGARQGGACLHALQSVLVCGVMARES
eukprot:1158274-Pelagomonas_calceolata.AAC.68